MRKIDTKCMACTVMAFTFAACSPPGENQTTQDINDDSIEDMRMDMYNIEDMQLKDLSNDDMQDLKIVDMQKEDMSYFDASMDMKKLDMPVNCTLACNIFDFRRDDIETRSEYDASTQAVTVYVTNDSQVIETGMGAAKTSGGGGGASFYIEGTVQNNTLMFDFSKVELNNGEYIETEYIDLKLECGESESFAITGNFSLDSSKSFDGFRCFTSPI